MNRFPIESRTPENAYGSWLHLEQDSREYLMVYGQKWVPHEVLPGSADWDTYGHLHPFLGCEGILVGISDWISGLYFGGATTGFITRVRTMRRNKSDRGRPMTHQVEILGRPTMWSAASHFERIT